MRRNEISEHLNRLHIALASAEILFQHDKYPDVVSRAYYAILHAARAALLVYDVVPNSHKHLRQAFGLYLVKSGEVEVEWAKILTTAYHDRANADYLYDFDISDENTEELILQAKRFIDRMKTFLESKQIEL